MRRVLLTSAAVRVKRSLKLDTLKKDTLPGETPLKTKSNLNAYSPTTGTRQMSPFSSPMTHNAQNPRNDPSNGDKIEEDDSESRLSRRGQPQTEEDAYLKLQSKVTSSLVRIANIRAKLTSLQALEGSRELVNIDVSDLPCILSDEMQRTQELMSQAEELQLLKKNHGKLPAQEYVQTSSSSTFLASLLD
ncbi:centromere protein R [Athene cunicularia]|uniref:centromere protein R n=1 Tax=Athene cunicularia TaxID=194338 RepID=UPI000EF6F22A|nr:centromere protein R [Athene cunicularia]XP_026709633.1 centromere protein R [Athene cunicularia]